MEGTLKQIINKSIKLIKIILNLYKKISMINIILL